MKRFPALPALILIAAPGAAQMVARPAPFAPASGAWAIVLRHFFESDFGRAAQLPPILAALRPLDLVQPAPKVMAGPLAESLLARSLTPGRFAVLPPERRLAELMEAFKAAEHNAAERAALALAPGLPDQALPDAVPLLAQLAGPLSLYVTPDTARRAAAAYSPLHERLRSARVQRLLADAEKAAAALAPLVPEPEPPHLRVRRANGPRELARLARQFSADLRRSPDPEARRALVNGLWELAEAPPSPGAHRAAARALARELGARSRNSEPQRLLMLRALRALGSRTPYEAVELRLVRAALDLSAGSQREKVAREAWFSAESVASLSPFPSVRRLFLRHLHRTAEWTGDDDRRKELELSIARFETPPAEDYWPRWKPPRPSGAWRRVLAALGF